MGEQARVRDQVTTGVARPSAGQLNESRYRASLKQDSVNFQDGSFDEIESKDDETYPARLLLARRGVGLILLLK